MIIMLHETMLVLWENVSMIFLWSCVVSILSVLGTWAFTRNIADDLKRMIQLESVIKSENCNTAVEKVIGDKEESATVINNAVDDSSTVGQNASGTISQDVQRKVPELTEEEKIKEFIMQKEQLEEIFELIKNNTEKFGMNSMTEIEEQMKTYYT